MTVLRSMEFMKIMYIHDIHIGRPRPGNTQQNLSGTGNKQTKVTGYRISAHRIPEVHQRHVDGATITRRGENPRFLGKLNFATQAIPTTPLFYRSIKGRSKEELDGGGQDYQKTVIFSDECRVVIVGTSESEMGGVYCPTPTLLNLNDWFTVYQWPGREN